MDVDVHQHVWPEPFVEALRRRSKPPYLDDWTLVLDGEPPSAIDPRDHDTAARAELARADGFGRVLVAPSTPLGIEWLPPEEARPLLDAYHDGVAALGEPFAGWASACLADPGPAELTALLDRGFAGLTLPATALLDPAGYRACAPLLDALAAYDRPLFVHPGPVPAAAGVPPWWPAVVGYVQQMHAAWYAFRAFGRPRHPGLRVCFALLAGLAPLHGERLAARGGDDPLARGIVDSGAYVETSSYGPRAVDATVRVLGIDAVLTGSDRPYAAPRGYGMGDAAEHALRSANPLRLLGTDAVRAFADADLMEVDK
ncbi:MAG TPA: amidohydrolase [Streptosporangiaceae bacterium]